MSAREGGAAFPVVIGERQIGPHEKEFDTAGGMSLRDWFAGQALGYLAGRKDIEIKGAMHLGLLVYELADAMLAARAGQPEGEAS